MSTPGSRRRTVSATEQPGNSFRYLYWRLPEKSFQQLCGTLLRLKFDGVRCYPVGMADEGIDAIVEGSVVFQVKWSSKLLQNPDAWLARTIKAERAKILRLVEQKRISRYVLMTSVAGTTNENRSGSIQKLELKLKEYSDEFGIPVECWWQADIDAEVDAAPDAVKWSYQEMLAGSEAVRYLIHGAHADEQVARTREMVKRVMATQWRDDSKVKFSQVELDGVSLIDLFITARLSVPGERLVSVGGISGPGAVSFSEENFEYDAVDYLQRSHRRLVFMLGVPGQGKSTLGQYLCQLHRAALLSDLGGDQDRYPVPDEPVFPFRLDLKDYAAWLSGFDPFGDDEPPAKPRRRRKDESSLETYLAAFCTAYSGGTSVSVADIHDLLARFPVLLVLDGLDEVADSALRETVVEQIDRAVTRIAATGVWQQCRVLVTSRPNASGQAEPDALRFQTVQLEPLTPVLQLEFVNTWCDIKNIHGRDRRSLIRTFEDRSKLDHIAQLTDNPMQLAILLYLIYKNGEAVSTSRTPLYTEYLDTLLSREVTRQQIDRNLIPLVQEVTAFLGWHIQSGVEKNASTGRMTVDDIRRAMLLYLHEVGGPIEDVDKLFRASSDRFWALTSKVAGTFEFVVQPLREYFAAKFLAEWAGRRRREPLLKHQVLQQLIDRSYWLNTARFYAGFASPNELASLRYGLEEAIERGRHPLLTRTAVWTLISDGIFADDAPVQRDVTVLLTDELSITLIATLPGARATFPHLTRNNGGERLAATLMDAIAGEPDSPGAELRAQMLSSRGLVETEFFQDWWLNQLREAAGTSREAAWLKIGVAFGLRHLAAAEANRLGLLDAAAAQAAFAIGASPDAGSEADRRLLRAALDGWGFSEIAEGFSEGADLLKVLPWEWDGTEVERGEKTRAEAWSRLLARNSAYEELAQAEGRLDCAQALARIHGPCWLAAELAIGTLPNRGSKGSGLVDSNADSLGARTDYRAFAAGAQQHHLDDGWWQEIHDRFPDRLSRQTWTLALLCSAAPFIIIEKLALLDACITGLSDDEFLAFASSASRLSVWAGRSLEGVVLKAVTRVSPRTIAVLSHFGAEWFAKTTAPGISEELLAEVARLRVPSRPIYQAVANRFAEKPTNALHRLIATLDPNELGDWDIYAPVLSGGDIGMILEHPGRYPWRLVLDSETWHSRRQAEPSLAEVALAQDWTPKVPHF